jgi:hypothetical protein
MKRCDFNVFSVCILRVCRPLVFGSGSSLRSAILTGSSIVRFLGLIQCKFGLDGGCCHAGG